MIAYIDVASAWHCKVCFDMSVKLLASIPFESCHMENMVATHALALGQLPPCDEYFRGTELVHVAGSRFCEGAEA